MYYIADNSVVVASKYDRTVRTFSDFASFNTVADPFEPDARPIGWHCPPETDHQCIADHLMSGSKRFSIASGDGDANLTNIRNRAAFDNIVRPAVDNNTVPPE